MADFIQKTDTLNEGRLKLNEAIDEAGAAKVSAGQAVNTSNQAKQIAQTAETKAESVQAQFDQVVIEGDSSVEAAQARVDVKGNPHTTLKARLDAEQTAVASQLAETETKVKNFDNVINTKRLKLENDATATIKPIDIYNSGGQGTGNDQTSVSVHHYTDGPVANLDNVGTGNNILSLQNAQNTVKRKDKDGNFVGNGNFLRCRVFNGANGYHDILTIDQHGKFIKGSHPTDGQGVLDFRQLKADNGFWGVRFRNETAHVNAFVFQNGSSLVSIGTSDNHTKAVFRADDNYTNGLLMQARQGNLELLASNGDVTVAKGGKHYRVQSSGSCTTSTRPAGMKVGDSIFDTTLGKPIWLKATPNTWVDAMGTTV